MMKVTILQRDVLVEGPITLVALTATIQTMIVLIIDTFYYYTFNEYCYVFCYNILLKTNKQLVHFFILHMFKR